MEITSLRYADAEHSELTANDKHSGPANIDRWPGHYREAIQAYLDGGGTIEDYQEPPDLRTYAEKRKDAYPPVGDVIDAICKYLETGDKTEFDAIQVERNAVKAAIPITLE